MSNVNERDVWSSGSSGERHDELRKSLTASKKYNQPLFPSKPQEESVEKDSDSDSESSDDSESADSASSSYKPAGNITVGELRNRSRALMEKALADRGYPKELLEDDNFRASLAKALAQDGQIVSRKTGKAWIERAIPEEPPAFVRPGKLKIGDKVQLLNWTPMGVHGTTVDLFPRGNVTKLYTVKCLVTKEPLMYGCMAPDASEFDEEDRILGLEIDGRGPYPLKDGGKPVPFVTKDSSIIMRFPYMASPGGQTDHVEPGWY